MLDCHWQTNKQKLRKIWFWQISNYDWLIDCLIFTACQPIYSYLCLEVRESHSLYISIDVFELLFLRSFLHTLIWYQVFLSNANNFHTVVRFLVFLSNTNDNMVSGIYFYLTIIICLLFPYMLSQHPCGASIK